MINNFRNILFLAGAVALCTGGCASKIDTTLKSTKNDYNLTKEDKKILDEVVSFGYKSEPFKSMANSKKIKIYKYDDLGVVVRRIENKNKNILVKYDDYLKDNAIFEVFNEARNFKSVDDFAEYVNMARETFRIDIKDSGNYRTLYISSKNNHLNKIKHLEYRNSFFNSPLDAMYFITSNAGMTLSVDKNARKELLALRKEFYIGSAFDYIVKICKEKDLFYSIVDNKLSIEKIKTKIFPINIAAIETSTQIESSSKKDSQQLASSMSAIKINVKTALYTDILNNIMTILETNGQKGGVNPSKSSNQFTVSTTSSNLKSIANSINSFNDVYSKNIILKIKLIEVLLDENKRNGLDFTATKGDTGILTRLGTAALGNITSNSLTVDSEKFSSVLNFVNEFGKTKIVSSPSCSTLNTLETSIFLGKVKEYQSSIGKTPTVTDGVTTYNYSTEQKSVNSGINLVMKPSIRGDKIQIVLQLKVESLQGFDENVIGDTKTKSAEVKKKDFSHIISIKEGETFVLGGMKEIYSKKKKAGMPWIDESNVWTDYIGGIKERESYEVEQIVTIAI